MNPILLPFSFSQEVESTAILLPGKVRMVSAELSKYSEELASKEHIIVGTKIDEDGTEERFEELKAKYSDTVVLPLSIYRDDLMPDLKKNLLRLSGEKKEDGFTSRMDTDAHYRDEA